MKSVYRIRVENLAQIWSVANVTMCVELIETCVPWMASHFEGVFLKQPVLTQTTGEFFQLVLDNKQTKSASEETKIRAISEWIEAGFREGNADDRIDEFVELISKIQMNSVSESVLRELLKMERGVGRISTCK